MILLAACFVFAFLAIFVQIFIKRTKHKELLLKGFLRMSFISLCAFILLKAQFMSVILDLAKILTR